MAKKRHFDLSSVIIYLSIILLSNTYLSIQAAFSAITAFYFIFSVLSGSNTMVILTIVASTSHVILYYGANLHLETEETALLILLITGSFYIRSFTNANKTNLIFYFIALNSLPFVINHLMLDFRFMSSYINTYTSFGCYLITGAIPWLLMPVLVITAHIHSAK